MPQLSRSERRRARALEKLFCRKQPIPPRQYASFIGMDYAAVGARCLATTCRMHREENGNLVVEVLDSEEIHGLEEKADL